MRWPGSWRNPSALTLLEGSPIDALLIAPTPDLASIRSQARDKGLHVFSPGQSPPDVTTIQGVWPGIKVSRGSDAAEAGPTGVPWVDSNIWAARRAEALHPNTRIWIEAAPPTDRFITADSYRMAVADCASGGARWVIALDRSLAADLAAHKPSAQKPWQAILRSAAFFAAHDAWSAYTQVAVVGLVSDFSGDNEFFTGELLNLIDRAGQPAKPLVKGHADFHGLTALIYVDHAPPSTALRDRIADFVRAGGMLIATVLPAGESLASPLDGYALYASGKGKIAVARSAPEDPYQFANDCVVLVSHRQDLVRFWNGGATGFSYTASPDGKKAVVHLLFYTSRGPDAATVWVAGAYNGVRATTVDAGTLTGVRFSQRRGGTEVYLPPVSHYVALELEK
jgi:hypothetical protein